MIKRFSMHSNIFREKLLIKHHKLIVKWSNKWIFLNGAIDNPLFILQAMKPTIRFLLLVSDSDSLSFSISPSLTLSLFLSLSFDFHMINRTDKNLDRLFARSFNESSVDGGIVHARSHISLRPLHLYSFLFPHFFLTVVVLHEKKTIPQMYIKTIFIYSSYMYTYTLHV